ncbi:hypothetical protein [Streptomyces sp. NPDC018031]|uniref:hypothetical protein n=1 Tax=Streptomyces sp. NPDC018031 TaxID=3365033 RepID=UPI0037B34CEF
MSGISGVRSGARNLARWAATAAAALVVCALGTGPALADESPVNSHNGSRFVLIDVGQVDDPAEDVLENLSVLGTHTMH